MRSFFERVDVRGVALGVTAPRAASGRTLDAILGSMPADADAPFAFVQGAIRHVPYRGSVRGIHGTLESGGGNALDQAVLLRELLQARGLRARLVRGRLGWADAARLTVGTSTPQAPRPDDPWPRWLEDAADHWWVQVQRDGAWVDLDPSFPDSAAGEAVGEFRGAVAELPADSTTSVTVELRRGDLVLASAVLPAGDVVGGTVSLSFAAQSETAVALWRTSERELARQALWFGDIARAIGLLPRPAAVETDPGSRAVTDGADAAAPPVPQPERAPRPSAFERLFLDAKAGPWHAQLELPGRVLEAGPLERNDLENLSVRIRVAAPQVPVHVFDTPWGGGPDGRLTIVLAAGVVSEARLAGYARSMFRVLNRLASAEQDARVEMRPPIAYRGAAQILAAAADAGWREFAASGPEMLGWVLLAAVDRVSDQSPAARVLRPGLRLVAVRWRPPEADSAGSLEARMSDPITVGQITGPSSASSLRAASGLLQSAVFSQVLNRLTERAPLTAFDVTLRAIGTGQRLAAFADAGALPAAWPVAVRAEAAAGIGAGYAVLAPESFGDGEPGWWTVGVADGETLGWVPGRHAALQGSVEVGAAGGHDDFESLLASLPSLHRALRWLADVRGNGPMALATVPAAACGSAAVAAEVMRTSVPQGWPQPEVLVLCGPR